MPPTEVLLLGAGPSPTSSLVRAAQAWPLLGHFDPEFLPILGSVQQRLRDLFGTTNAFTLPLAGTGTSGMEAVVGNLVEAGDRVVVGVHGVFGQRFAEAVRRRGADVVEVRTEFGAVPDPASIVAAIAAGPTRLCCVVHAETSTGVLLDRDRDRRWSRAVGRAGLPCRVDGARSPCRQRVAGAGCDRRRPGRPGAGGGHRCGARRRADDLTQPLRAGEIAGARCGAAAASFQARMNDDQIQKTIEESIATKQRLLTTSLPRLVELCRLAIATLRGGGKILLCGNGGSACDAAHAAGELVGWFEKKQRPPFAAIALGHTVPTLTAIGNDAGYEHVFAREVEGIGRAGDLLIGFTTSGGSRNVVAALRQAKSMGLATAVLCGEKRGAVLEHADVAVQVPSSSTPRIQESHLLCVHVLCAAVEEALSP